MLRAGEKKKKENLARGFFFIRIRLRALPIHISDPFQIIFNLAHLHDLNTNCFLVRDMQRSNRDIDIKLLTSFRQDKEIGDLLMSTV